MPQVLIDSEELEGLRQRLELAEQTLDAIRHGRVDAVVVEGRAGDQVYTLTGADRPYRVMVEEMQDAAVVLSEAGVILYCNRRLARILRATYGDLLGSPFLHWLEGPSRSRFERLLTGCAEGACRTELRFVASDGAPVPVYAAVNLLPVEEKRLVSIVATDLTEQKRHEARMEQRTAELTALTHELEAFSYSVSHDLRAPLRHIVGFIRMLNDRAGTNLDAEGHRYLRIIGESADRMSALIDDLLALSRIGRAAMHETDVDLRHLVDEAIDELAAEANGRGIQWQIGRLPRLRGDRLLLKTVMVNLLSNAIKYTRPRNPAHIEIGAEEQDAEVVCFVRDNGVGFDMQFAHKLFGVFQRLHTSEEFEGTGIGLASVRRVVQRHGGRTWAEGAIDHGATFYFSLPRKKVDHD